MRCRRGKKCCIREIHFLGSEVSNSAAYWEIMSIGPRRHKGAVCTVLSMNGPSYWSGAKYASTFYTLSALKAIDVYWCISLRSYTLFIYLSCICFVFFSNELSICSFLLFSFSFLLWYIFSFPLYLLLPLFLLYSIFFHLLSLLFSFSSQSFPGPTIKHDFRIPVRVACSNVLFHIRLIRWFFVPWLLLCSVFYYSVFQCSTFLFLYLAEI